MSEQHTFSETASNPSQAQSKNMGIDNNNQNHQPSLVPKRITIGLGVFAFILSLAGYGFRLLAGHDLKEVLLHAAVLVPAFVLGIPLLFWLGSKVMNKVKGMNIEARNAITLGLLTSCVSLLWLMGTYS